MLGRVFEPTSGSSRIWLSRNTQASGEKIGGGGGEHVDVENMGAQLVGGGETGGTPDVPAQHGPRPATEASKITRCCVLSISVDLAGGVSGRSSFMHSRMLSIPGGKTMSSKDESLVTGHECVPRS